MRIAATAMSYAVKGVTTERGLDAGAFAMVVYGGAGPLHASAIARELGIRRVLVPDSPGHFSAYGMLFSDLRYDYVRSVFERLATVSFERIEELYRDMEERGRAAIAKSAIAPDSITISRAADMRYVGQEHAVTVDLDNAIFEKADRAAIKSAFDAVHLQRYGTSAPNEPSDLVSLRVTVAGVVSKPPREKLSLAGEAPGDSAKLKMRKVCFSAKDGFVDTPIYLRDGLKAGNRIRGPALIEEHASTTVLMPDDLMAVDAYGNLDIAVGGAK